MVLSARYRSALGATVATSAGPYGYTLTIWTSGAVLSHAHGIPSTTAAFLFLLGAVAAYALVGGLAFGGLSEHVVLEPTRAAVWGGLHFLSVGLAIGAALLVARWDASLAAWPLGGFSGDRSLSPRIGVGAHDRASRRAPQRAVLSGTRDDRQPQDLG